MHDCHLINHPINREICMLVLISVEMRLRMTFRLTLCDCQQRLPTGS